ncbi:CaaX prenyl proteinase Rce1 [Cordyceps militaris CM01]|uniref:intramembrane prenyl-peptidase Rce1 n=1 Tax=Cordyceps militaris (strain CM01) TaxID=983644 RepID=G3JHB5_CORMM|nr:CaaX prenyl proteinase Rce1 [Cordyceps militaris CM01]EGX91671.1 CaaX prenyl proteinase Rce1 [Cordyceps militaris CM01]
MKSTAATPAAELTTLQASGLMVRSGPKTYTASIQADNRQTAGILGHIRATSLPIRGDTALPNAVQGRPGRNPCPSCSVVTLITICCLSQQHPALFLMGYWPIRLIESAKALLLTAVLFAGPLYENLFIDGDWRHLGSGLRHLWQSWPTWRNIVAGPVTEECLFRSAVVPLLVLAKANTLSIIFLSPLVFGVAHMHHFYEFRLTNPGVPIYAAVARTIIQLTYTSVFGAYVTFLFLQTGSLLAVVLVHAFCNCLGLPRVWGYMYPYWLPINATKGTLLKWTIPYYIFLVGGLLYWRQNLHSLTESPLGLLK